MENKENWVSVSDRIPDKNGLYRIKTTNGVIIHCPLAHSLSGKLVWVIPDEKQITHWIEK